MPSHHEMTTDQKSLDKMTVDEISLDKMTVDEMSLDEMTVTLQLFSNIGKSKLKPMS